MNLRRHKRYKLYSEAEVPTDQDTSHGLWDVLEDAFDALCHAFNECQWTPLSQGDVSGFLYHSLISSPDGNLTRVHLQAPVFLAAKHETFDLVVGDLVSPEAQRQRVLDYVGHRLKESTKQLLLSSPSLTTFTPAVRGDLILLVQLLTPGRLPQQLQQAESGIERLRGLKGSYQYARGIILFDSSRCATPGGLEDLLGPVRSYDPSLRIYLLQPSSDCKLCWRICMDQSEDPGSGT